MRAALSLLLLLVGVASAEAAAYRLTAADTLRYRYVSDGTIVTKAPQGTVNGSARVDAIAVVAGEDADSATASLKRLIVMQRGPDGTQRPNTDAVLGQPFRLHFPGSGRISVVRSPELPEDVAAMANVPGQLEAMFISLPPAELASGVSWSDTLQQLQLDGKNKSDASSIRQFKVVRDTVVAETPALIISVIEKKKVRGTRYLEEQKATVDIDLKGEESGFAVFAPTLGRLLSRRSQGRLEGSMGFEGSGSRLSVAQTIDFTNTVDLLP